MGLQKLKVTIRGVSPFLSHNGQTADPLNAFSKQLKAVTSKRKKTDEDYAEMSRIEWHAGLYVNADGYVVLPATLMESCLVEGAKKSKLGKAFKSAVFIDADSLMKIGTTKKAAELWEDARYRDVRGVRVGTSRVMRTRPIFHNWEADVEIMFDDEQVNQADVEQALNDAGSKCGVGDFRPRFGRFDVVS
jgi:hypothetical protein